MKFAIIKTGGKQYQVSKGDTLTIEKIETPQGAQVAFDQVLMVADEDKDSATVNIGIPLVAGAKVMGTVVEQGRGKKIVIIKYKAKTRHRSKRGHRQMFTKVKIDGIEG